jgi:hypothetical protein
MCMPRLPTAHMEAAGRDTPAGRKHNQGLGKSRSIGAFSFDSLGGVRWTRMVEGEHELPDHGGNTCTPPME